MTPSVPRSDAPNSQVRQHDMRHELGWRTNIAPYMLNCGLLMLPILLWNAALSSQLRGPWSADVFWHAIPFALSAIENSSRWLVTALPFLMRLELRSSIQVRGLIVFHVGVAAYAASWVAILLAPDSAWSTSVVGFVAPAGTPAIWLLGLAMLGQRLHCGQAYRWWMYLVPATVFVIAHVTHAALVYTRLH